MFYFQQLLNIALSGIDATSIIPTVTNIAYGILLVGFLVALYQAVLSGGDVQALAVAAIKYAVIAIIIANWSTIFREVNSSFDSIAQFIGNSSGAKDMFLSWLDQLQRQFSGDTGSFWDAITGTIAALIGTVLIVVAYLVFVIALIFFCFFYTLYGSILYILGPLILALLPMLGVGQLAKSFATNLMIWNAWGVIYAAEGALITAVQMNQVGQVGGGGFLGFMRGPVDSLILGFVSIFFALSIALIPFIAKRIISGDVGATAMSLVQAGVAAAGVALAAGQGFGAGASAGAGGGGGSGASSGGSGGGGAGGGGGSAASSSSSAPAAPSNAGQAIRAGIASAVGGSSSPSAPAGSNSSGGGSESAQASGGGSGSTSSDSDRGNSGDRYRPHGVVQTLAYRASRAAGRAVRNGKDNQE